MADLDLYGVVTDQLFRDNGEVLAGRMTARTFGRLWARRVRPVRAGRGDRRLLAAHGMVAASMERHFGDAAAPAHWDRPELPSATTLRSWADDGPLREVLGDYVTGPHFLGSPGEITFKANVAIIGAAYREALDAVEPLTDPGSWDSADVVERLIAARASFELANATHRTQARAPIEDRRDFADRVRGFFRPRTVAGVDYEGLNAAHEPDVAVMDCVLGTDDHRYRLYLRRSVRPHLLAADRVRFDTRLVAGSLRGALSERLGVRDFLVEPVDLTAVPLPTRAAVATFADVLKAHAAVSNAHRGVIRAVLEQRQDEPDVARGIDVSLGSGGRPHDETDALRRMRHSASRQLLERLPSRTAADRGRRHRADRADGA